MKVKSHKKMLASLLALALLCICITELIACRFFDPALFDTITTPIIRTASDARIWVDTQWQNAHHKASVMLANAQETISNILSRQDEAAIQISGQPITPFSAPNTDSEITRFAIADDGTETIIGGLTEVVYFNQNDAAWHDAPYGQDYIGRYGCGPTCLAMVVASMTDIDTNPQQMAEWSADNGHWASKSGSYLSLIPEGAAAFGLQANSLTEKSADNIIQELLCGNLIVALMGPGHFTTGGHFIILHGTTLTGEILVADPNSREITLTPWDSQIILDELSSSTAAGAPIWVISHLN